MTEALAMQCSKAFFFPVPSTRSENVSQYGEVALPTAEKKGAFPVDNLASLASSLSVISWHLARESKSHVGDVENEFERGF